MIETERNWGQHIERISLLCSSPPSLSASLSDSSLHLIRHTSFVVLTLLSTSHQVRQQAGKMARLRALFCFLFFAFVVFFFSVCLWSGLSVCGLVCVCCQLMCWLSRKRGDVMSRAMFAHFCWWPRIHDVLFQNIISCNLRRMIETERNWVNTLSAFLSSVHLPHRSPHLSESSLLCLSGFLMPVRLFVCLILLSVCPPSSSHPPPVSLPVCCLSVCLSPPLSSHSFCLPSILISSHLLSLCSAVCLSVFLCHSFVCPHLISSSPHFVLSAFSVCALVGYRWGPSGDRQNGADVLEKTAKCVLRSPVISIHLICHFESSHQISSCYLIHLNSSLISSISSRRVISFLLFPDLLCLSVHHPTPVIASLLLSVHHPTPVIASLLLSSHLFTSSHLISVSKGESNAELRTYCLRIASDGAHHNITFELKKVCLFVSVSVCLSVCVCRLSSLSVCLFILSRAVLSVCVCLSLSLSLSGLSAVWLTVVCVGHLSTLSLSLLSLSLSLSSLSYSSSHSHRWRLGRIESIRWVCRRLQDRHLLESQVCWSLSFSLSLSVCLSFCVISLSVCQLCVLSLFLCYLPVCLCLSLSVCVLSVSVFSVCLCGLFSVWSVVLSLPLCRIMSGHVLISSHFVSSHFISLFNSSHSLLSPHLISSHLISSAEMMTNHPEKRNRIMIRHTDEEMRNWQEYHIDDAEVIPPPFSSLSLLLPTSPLWFCSKSPSFASPSDSVLLCSHYPPFDRILLSLL